MQKRSFKVSPDIYPQEALDTAIADFAEVANISYKKGEVTIEHEEEAEIDAIFNEFMNYTLSVLTELHS